MSDSSSRHIVIDARNRRSSTGRYTDRLLEHLQKVDNENQYTILVSPGDSWQPSNNNFNTRECKYQQFSLNPFEQIGFAWQLYRLKPALVHFTMTQQPLLYFGKIVTTTHDLTMLRFVRPKGKNKVVHWIKMLGYRLLFWSAHQKSKVIIVPTNFVKEDLSQYQPFTADKIAVTYEASEPPIKNKAEAVPGVAKPFIFHVGSPFPHKNIERLIETYEILRQKNPGLALVLAGKREYYFEKLEEWHKDRSSYRSTVYTGFIPDSQLKWLYKNAEAYALPSLSEGFGLPGLEAMAHGCPVVSSNATCLPEVYGEAAVYFDPTDINNMAQSIEKVLDSSNLRKKLAEAGKDQIQHYSWEKMANETHGIYTSLL